MSALGRDLGEPGFRHEHGAERDPPGPVARELVDAGERAHAAAHVDREAVDGADGLDGSAVGRARLLVLLERGGQVDDMHPSRALLGERAGHGDRVVGVHFAAAAVAALQAHDLATDQVDGGKQDHERTSRAIWTKLPRIRAPVAEDFSGWNWQPHTLPERATHAKLRA